MRPTEDEIGTPPQGARTAMIAGSGLAAQQVLALGTTVLAAHVLGARDFGLVNLARGIVGLLAVAAALGLDLGLQSFLATGPGTAAHRLRQLPRLRGLSRAVAAAMSLALLFGGAALLERTLLPVPHLAATLAAMALSLPFLADMAVLGGAYRGMLRPGPSLVVDLMLHPALRFTLLLVLFSLGLRVSGVVVATVAAAVISWGILCWRASRDLAPPTGARGVGPAGDASPATTASRSGDSRASAAVVRISLVLAGAMGITSLARSLDLFALGRWAAVEDVGAYALAQSMVAVASLCGAVVGQTAGPEVARHHARGDAAGMASVIGVQARLRALAAAPICAAIAFWGPDAAAVAGRSFALAPAAAGILAATALATATLSPAGYALSMTGRHRREIAILATGLAASGIGCALLVPGLGQSGAAAGAAAGSLVVHVLRLRHIRTLFGIRVLDPRLASIALAAFGLALAVRLSTRLLAATPGATAAALALFLLGQAVATWCWLLTERERAAVRGLMGRLRRSTWGVA